MKQLLITMLAASYLSVLAPTIAEAQQPAAAKPTAATDDTEELAKKLSNPISDLVSIPFQFNWEQKVGPLEVSRFILNIQPVVPFALNKNWNMIARVIIPFIGQPPLFLDGEAASHIEKASRIEEGDFRLDGAASGIGDITASLFFSPKTSGGFMIGVGPAFLLPASYQPTIGSGQWSIGPTVVALEQKGQWTYGALWNQVWSFAGDRRREDVNQMFLQPFLAYQANKTITLTIQSETTADWEAHDDKWTVPINLLVSKLSNIGLLPASFQLGVGGFPAHPDIGPSWKIRAAIILLLPKLD